MYFYCADGVALIDPEYLKGRKLFGQIVCSFRYGREEDEVMGLEFQKDLLMASGEIRASQKSDLTKMQVKYAKHWVYFYIMLNVFILKNIYRSVWSKN